METQPSTSEPARVSSGPTLALVGSTGEFEGGRDQQEVVTGTPTLVAVSATTNENVERKEGGVEDTEQPGTSTSILDENGVKRPRLTTTLLIFKKPSHASDDYVIANAAASDQDDPMEGSYHRSHKKKKKKHKSREKVVSISRSYAEKLLEIQKSISTLSTKHRKDSFEDAERRHKGHGHATCSTPLPETPILRSPAPPTPLLGKPSSFHGHGYRANTLLSRKRQMSTNSSLEVSTHKRRYTRKKRYETEESNGVLASEDMKKNHLSENNVWSPLDDYRLLSNSMQTKGDLDQVYAGSKFSCFYTFDQIVHRWETLLYDEKPGILAQNAINNLHPLVKAKILTESLFSDEEESLLRTVKAVPGGNPELSSFTKLLEENPDVFTNRTPRKLILHWMDLRNFHLLDGQNVQDYKDPFNLYELQDNAYLSSVPDLAVYHELQTESKQVKRQIRILEEEIESWHCMQELVVSDGTSDLHSIFSITEFDDQTFAILRGKQVRYHMRSKEILLGRHSTNNKVDADLTLEGASGKVSRRQAIIQMHGFGEFFIINQGKHSIFVDSMHVPFGGMAKLTDACVIQITHIKLIFKINEKLMRTEVTREVRKEVLNARLKSLETFSSPTYTPVSPIKPGVDVLPSTSRYSPKKKHNVANGSNGYPMISLGGSVVASPSAIRSGIRSGGSTSSGSMGVSMFPFTNDLTIRPSYQPPVTTPYLSDMAAKSQYSRTFNTGASNNDNDIFKKPAPVPILKLPSNKSSPVRVSQAQVSTASALPSAFVSVGGILPSTSYVNNVSSERTNTATYTNDTITTAIMSAVASTSSQRMDSEKLGLSGDVAVTQMRSESSSSTPHTSAIFSINENSKTLPASATSDTSNNVPVSIPSASLGVIKTESPSPNTHQSMPPLL